MIIFTISVFIPMGGINIDSINNYNIGFTIVIIIRHYKVRLIFIFVSEIFIG